MRIKFNKLFETILLETHYDEKAAEQLAASGLFDLNTSKAIIQGLFREDIHAFVNCKSWLEKYLKGIVRMLVDESNGDRNKAVEFLNECPNEFEQYFTYAREYRPTLKSDKERIAFDDKFVKEMSYQDVKDFNEELRKAKREKEQAELANMKFDNSSDYELIPIDSYEDMHSQFGGHWTGNGTGDSSAWCHTNGKGTYDAWTNNGQKMFVLAKKGWKDIPFDSESCLLNLGKDDYGNSLIAIRANKYGEIDRVTLRCNHQGVEGIADNQYTVPELSKLVGFNVEDKIQEFGDFEESPIKDGIYYYDGGEVPEELQEIIEKVIVKEGVTKIGEYAFYDCTSLKSITIPNSVTKIDDFAFYHTSLESITIPDSVTKIGKSAFSYCASLKSITIPNSVTEIDEFAFYECKSLESITIPNSVTRIGNRAFKWCGSLKSIIIPDSVTKIETHAFYGCSNLTVYCNEDSYVYEYCIKNSIKVDTSRRI